MSVSQASNKSDQHSNHPVLSRYEPVIGLEVHCQLATATKLFCGCSTVFGHLPNHNTCPVCLGMPGVLPVINKQAVEFAIRVALAVGGNIRPRSVFARKQYFYPDLPKGYQISQYDLPYCEGGGLKIASGVTVELTRIHLEEDAGKSVHGGDHSFVDLNRAGIPLIEIVTGPVLHSPADAVDYLKRLRSLVRHLGVSDGNLEEGSFRCDANVSIRKRGDQTLGTRCEIKNLNSFRNIEKAISYEIIRQADCVDHNEPIIQQTLLYDAAKGRTQPMRSKEESQDYRYFPDPDLTPLVITEARIAAARAALPELPAAMAMRFREAYGLGDADAEFLTSDRDVADYFETVVALTKDVVTPKIVANWVNSELMAVVNEKEWDFPTLPIKPEAFAELLGLIGNATISGKIAKSVFANMIESGLGASEIVEKQGLRQVTDRSVIEQKVGEILDAHPEQVAQFLAGKDKVLGFFVGQIMRASGGKLNPDLVNEILNRKLAEKRI